MEPLHMMLSTYSVGQLLKRIIQDQASLPGGSQDAMTASKKIDLWLFEG
jgi:hypothetical protein